MKPGTVLLGRNLLAGIGTFRYQQALLTILRLAGPSTTRELYGYCELRVPITLSQLQRFLGLMRKVHAVRVYPSQGGRGASDPVFWALPGQPPPSLERRQQYRRVPVDRRQEPSASPAGSWWVHTDRQAFQRALRERWTG